jgi:AraC-like DNA-binding protein
MTDFEFVQTEYHDCHSFMGVQMLRSCYCHLEKWEFRNLSAPFWRWYHNTNSGAFLILSGRRIALSPARIFLIPPNTALATETKRPIKQLYLHFTLDLKYQPSNHPIFSHPCDAEERALMSQLIRALPRDGRHNQLKISFLSQALVNLALGKSPAEHWGSQPSDPRIELARAKISRHAPLALSNRQLARELGLSLNTFTRLFKETSGHTPHQYLTLLRLEQASQLLQHSDQSIENIAEQTGFYDRFHFSRMFRLHFHNNPAAFRRCGRS